MGVKRYRAVYGKGILITIVSASSVEEAQKVIEDQLDRPGRREFYRYWVRDGMQVEEVIPQ